MCMYVCVPETESSEGERGRGGWAGGRKETGGTEGKDKESQS